MYPKPVSRKKKKKKVALEEETKSRKGGYDQRRRCKKGGLEGTTSFLGLTWSSRLSCTWDESRHLERKKDRNALKLPFGRRLLGRNRKSHTGGGEKERPRREAIRGIKRRYPRSLNGVGGGKGRRTSQEKNREKNRPLLECRKKSARGSAGEREASKSGGNPTLRPSGGWRKRKKEKPLTVPTRKSKVDRGRGVGNERRK